MFVVPSTDLSYFKLILTVILKCVSRLKDVDL
jgi:hypothetical protein